MNRFTAVAAVGLAVAIAALLGWRMVNPPSHISVSSWFAQPVATLGAAAPGFDISAESCGFCHAEAHGEWSSTVHAGAWRDEFFQIDWRRGGANPICRNCHTPLDRQQERIADPARFGDGWNAAALPNPAFEPALRQEGVTCAACHLRDGVVYGPLAGLTAPHPTAAWSNPNVACVRCHAPRNNDWDAVLRTPPCGTASEVLRASGADPAAGAAEDRFLKDNPVANLAALRCVECHMPAVTRPLVAGGLERPGRRHLWRGGHDLATLRAGLQVHFAKTSESAGETRFTLTLVNAGAGHDIPTGVPNRRLTVTLQTLDAAGKPLETQEHVLERRTLGRPFVIDLWDTRLRPNAPRVFTLTASAGQATAVEAVVRYWLMRPIDRDRFDYRQEISQEIFRARIPLLAEAHTN